MLKLYTVTVYLQGSVVNRVDTMAHNALEAINHIEYTMYFDHRAPFCFEAREQPLT